MTSYERAWTLRPWKEAQTDLLAGFTTDAAMVAATGRARRRRHRDAINRGMFDGRGCSVSTKGIGAAGDRLYRDVGNRIVGRKRIDSTASTMHAKPCVNRLHYGADWIKVFPTGAYSSTPVVNVFVDLDHEYADELKLIVDEAHRHNGASPRTRTAVRDCGTSLSPAWIRLSTEGLDDSMVELTGSKRNPTDDPIGVRSACPRLKRMTTAVQAGIEH